MKAPWLVLAAGFVCSCGAGSHERDLTAPNCAPRPSGWSGPGDPPPHLTPVLIFRLERGGDISSGGTINLYGSGGAGDRTLMADDQLATSLRQSREWNPKPVVSLLVAEGAACLRLQEVRELVQSNFECSTKSCNEGGFDPNAPY